MAESVGQEGLFYPGAEAAQEIDKLTASQVVVEPLPRRRWLSRRLVLRWAGWGTILLVLTQWTTGFLSFFWPKKIGAFGGQVNVGALTDFQVGDVKRVTEGKFYLSRLPEGVVALWWKCPHLGCTVPWKPDDPTEDEIKDKGRFNCPCHGSIYNRYGDIVKGPAPRPMDLFGIEIRDGKIYVDTNPTKVKQRSRSTVKNDVTSV